MNSIQQKAEELLLQKRMNIEGKIPDIAQKIGEDSNWVMFAYSLTKAASIYFVHCPDDFCIQHVGAEVVIFGGTNRLRWSPAHGFVPDPLYCTENFMVTYKGIGPIPGSVGDIFWGA